MSRAAPDVQADASRGAAVEAQPRVRRIELLGWLLVTAGGLALDLAVFGPQDVTWWLPDVAVGWAFIGGGLLLRARPSDGRMAFLLGLTGVAWFLGSLAPALVFAHRGPLVHLVFAYPSGRLSGVGRVVVPVAYAVALFPAAWADERATLGLAVALAVVVEVHRRETAGPVRRARQQAAAAAGVVGIVLVGSALARLVFVRGDADRLTFLAYAAVLVAVAVATTRGVLRTTWRRAPVTDLVVQLGGERSQAVRDALARALGDPSLEVGYRDGDGYVDAAGRPVTFPTGGDSRASTVVRQRGEPVAILVHDPAVLADAALLHAVAVAARLAARNDRLRADVRARVADLEDSRRRLVAAADSERGRLAQRLADGAARRLAAVGDSLDRAHAASAAAAAQIARASAELERTGRGLQELATGLDPVPNGDLTGALTALAAGAPVPVGLALAEDRLPADVASAMWFVAAEAVTNAVKHANATGIAVELTVGGGTAELAVSDDGRGGADLSSGSGLRGLADRVDALDGTLRICSPPGGGTTVRVTLPADHLS